MENNDINTDYHKFVTVGDQKWEIVEITIRNISFAWDSYLIFFMQEKYQFPPKISIWPKSLLYKRSEKWLSPAWIIPSNEVLGTYPFNEYFNFDR